MKIPLLILGYFYGAYGCIAQLGAMRANISGLAQHFARIDLVSAELIGIQVGGSCAGVEKEIRFFLVDQGLYVQLSMCRPQRRTDEPTLFKGSIHALGE